MCKKCNFNTNNKSLLNRHINTILHQTGKRKTRSDKKWSSCCSHCDYKTSNKTNMKLHALNKHSTKKERKVGFKYYCQYCDCGSFAKSLHDNHIKTKKHKLIMELINSYN